MNIFPAKTNKVLKNIAYVVITISVIYSISNGILHALVNGLIWWFAFWILAKISNPDKKTNTSNINLNNSKDQEIDKKQPSEKRIAKKNDYSKPSKDFHNFIMVIGILVGLLIVGYFVLLGFSSKSDDGSMPLVHLETCLSEDIPLYTAETILKEYESNPYRTKISLEGTCVKLESEVREIKGNIDFVVFKDEFKSRNIEPFCTDFNKEDLLKLEVGEKFNIIGYINSIDDDIGFGHPFSIMLNDCRLAI